MPFWSKLGIGSVAFLALWVGIQFYGHTKDNQGYARAMQESAAVMMQAEKEALERAAIKQGDYDNVRTEADNFRDSIVLYDDAVGVVVDSLRKQLAEANASAATSEAAEAQCIAAEETRKATVLRHVVAECTTEYRAMAKRVDERGGDLIELQGWAFIALEK